jgi:hypothetical protein
MRGSTRVPLLSCRRSSRGATALSPDQRQHDQDGPPSTERQPQDLTPRREAIPLLLNEIEFLHHLRIGFSRVVSLTKPEAVGVMKGCSLGIDGSQL